MNRYTGKVAVITGGNSGIGLATAKRLKDEGTQVVIVGRDAATLALAHGAHGTFIKMPVGFVSPIHIHTEDYWGVVISGVAVNGLPGSTDVELPVGSYWFQKGGERHVTKCISPNECILFISQNGKFDYIADSAKK